VPASNPRLEEILALARRRGFVSIDELAQRFAVTTQTIRRDINHLCEEGVLRRYHGGAGLPSSVENLAYSTRQILCLEEKRRIARLVAGHIPDHASLFINIGTTTEEVA
jgi:DeoR family glycerol-3-phosphate regulon repressor